MKNVTNLCCLLHPTQTQKMDFRVYPRDLIILSDVITTTGNELNGLGSVQCSAWIEKWRATTSVVYLTKDEKEETALWTKASSPRVGERLDGVHFYVSLCKKSIVY